MPYFGIAGPRDLGLRLEETGHDALRRMMRRRVFIPIRRTLQGSPMRGERRKGRLSAEDPSSPLPSFSLHRAVEAPPTPASAKSGVAATAAEPNQQVSAEFDDLGRVRVFFRNRCLATH